MINSEQVRANICTSGREAFPSPAISLAAAIIRFTLRVLSRFLLQKSRTLREARDATASRLWQQTLCKTAEPHDMLPTESLRVVYCEDTRSNEVALGVSRERRRSDRGAVHLFLSH